MGGGVEKGRGDMKERLRVERERERESERERERERESYSSPLLPDILDLHKVHYVPPKQ